eukprot:gene17268-20593_t
MTGGLAKEGSVRLLTETEKVDVLSKDSNKVILIMAYKRIDDFDDCLVSLATANLSAQYHVIVTQSMPPSGDTSFYEHADEIIGRERSRFKSITHISTQSTSPLPYGNAYHAFRNLARGISYAYKAFPKLDSLIIVEEDVEVSKDIFEFFEASRDIMATDTSVRLATIRNELSLSLLDPKSLVKVRLQGEIEFKVLAWMMHPSIATQMLNDFYQIEDWVFIKGEDIIENKPGTPKPEVLQKNSDSWNHDRYLELRFRELSFIGSAFPRCNHMTGAGLSNPGDDYGFPVCPHYIAKHEFTQTSIRGEKSVWGVLKDYLPRMECPNHVAPALARNLSFSGIFYLRIKGNSNSYKLTMTLPMANKDVAFFGGNLNALKFNQPSSPTSVTAPGVYLNSCTNPRGDHSMMVCKEVALVGSSSDVGPRNLTLAISDILSDSFGLPHLDEINQSTGSSITLRGYGFGESPIVLCKATEVKPDSVTPHDENGMQTLVFLSPETGLASVQLKSGGFTSNMININVNLPSLDQVTTGSTSGSIISIRASGFSSVDLSVPVTVTFGENITVQASVLNPGDNPIFTCICPIGGGKDIPVTVNLANKPSTRFSYTPPIITKLLHDNIKDLVNVLGTNFGLDPTVTIGGKTVQPIANNHTHITLSGLEIDNNLMPIMLTLSGQSSNIVILQVDPIIFGAKLDGTFGKDSNKSIIIINGEYLFGNITVVVDALPCIGTSVGNNQYTYSCVVNLPPTKLYGAPAPTIRNVILDTPLILRRITIIGIDFDSTSQLSIAPQTDIDSEAIIQPTNTTPTMLIVDVAPALARNLSFSGIFYLRIKGNSNSYKLNIRPIVTASTLPVANKNVTFFGGNLNALKFNQPSSQTSVTVPGVYMNSCTNPKGHHSVMVCKLDFVKPPSDTVAPTNVTLAISDILSDSFGLPHLDEINQSTGSSITLRGYGFGESPIVLCKATEVKPDSVTPPDENGMQTLVFLSPETGLASVQLKSGGFTSNMININVNLPSLDQVTIGSTSGSLISIRASGFSSVDLSVPVTVTFGENITVPASVLNPGDNPIFTCICPVGGGKDIPVTVNLANKPSTRFSYTPPMITKLLHDNIKDLVNVLGTNFGLDPIVTIGGKTVQPIANNHTHITLNGLEIDNNLMPIMLTLSDQSSNIVILQVDPIIFDVKLDGTFGKDSNMSIIIINGEYLFGNITVLFDALPCIGTSVGNNQYTYSCVVNLPPTKLY